MSAEDNARRAILYARWGKPQAVDSKVALALLGLPPQGDVAAFRYTSVAAARAFAASNLEHSGYRSLGIAETVIGVIGVIHLPVPGQRTAARGTLPAACQPGGALVGAACLVGVGGDGAGAGQAAEEPVAVGELPG